MKKSLIITIALLLLCLVACTDTVEQNALEEDVIPSQAVSPVTVTDSLPSQDIPYSPTETTALPEPNDSPKPIETEASPSQTVSPEPSDFIEFPDDAKAETYTIIHENDGTSYTVKAVQYNDYEYTIYIFDDKSDELQSLFLGWCPGG